MYSENKVPDSQDAQLNVGGTTSPNSIVDVDFPFRPHRKRMNDSLSEIPSIPITPSQDNKKSKKKKLTETEIFLQKCVKRAERVHAQQLDARPGMVEHVNTLRANHQNTELNPKMIPLSLRNTFLELDFKMVNEVELATSHFCEFVLAVTNRTRTCEHYLEVEEKVLDPLFEEKKSLLRKSQHEGLRNFKKNVQSLVTCCPVKWIDQLVYCEQCGSQIKFNILDIHKKTCRISGCEEEFSEDDWMVVKSLLSPDKEVIDLTLEDE
jgi:hypothetical protein